MCLSALVVSCSHLGSVPLSEEAIETLIQESEKHYVEELSREIAIFRNVAFGLGIPLRAYLNQRENIKGKTILDLGSGSGVLSLIAIKNGAGKAVATDINPYAVANANYNAKLLNFEDKMDVRLVPMDEQGAYSVIKQNEKFELIVSNPPQGREQPENIYEYSHSDPGLDFFRSILKGLKQHLSINGRGVFALYYRTLTLAQQMANELNMEVNILQKTSNRNGLYYLVEIRPRKK